MTTRMVHYKNRIMWTYFVMLTWMTNSCIINGYVLLHSNPTTYCPYDDNTFQKRQQQQQKQKQYCSMKLSIADKNDYVIHEEESTSTSSNNKNSDMLFEKAWRYIKKPLLRIGAKGITSAHGNSLCELLESHTAVKVKINQPDFESSIEAIFHEICNFANQAGAPIGIELIQARTSERVILFGMPGTKVRIMNGEFPPPPPPLVSEDSTTNK